MNILILSPYDAASHQYWWRALVDQLSMHKCVVVTLPARYFSWRFRGNSLTLSHDKRLQASYDLIIATSMTDMSALKGFCPSIHNTPTVLYFHENQFAYPDQGDPHHLIERQMTSIYSAIVAKQLVFNSEFNKTTFLQGVAHLLKKMPDGIPPGIKEGLESKSRIISVSLRPMNQSQKINLADSMKAPVNIVWNHRWEHDKGLEELEMFVSMLINSGIDFRFHLIGQSFRKVPQSINNVIELLRKNQKLGSTGFIERRDDYLQLLGNCQIVLSTARHEFQGLAVLEAIQAGCIPIVPDALAYKEFIDGDFRYANLDEALALIEHHTKNPLASIPELPLSIEYGFVAGAWHKLVSELS
ncbi:MAG: glycosyltransferase involved in cell wall biosynthesis [Flavobacterium sp.]|jgi:glycosyltransferase involved in cell wall biosynthesis